MVGLDQAEEKTCPFCAETIKAAAVKCRYCQSDLTAMSAQPAGEPAGEPASNASVGDAKADELSPDETDELSPDEVDELAPPPPEAWISGQSRQTVPFLASFRLLSGLVALCLVLVLVVALAWYRSENPSEGKAPNGVITSSQARDAGLTAAATLTQKVLSYDWKTLAADMKSSEAVLAPSFRTEYLKAMNGVKAQTVKNQVKLTAAVVATSIISASTTKVEALVFVNQITTAKGSGNQRLDQNRVRVTLTRNDGDWRVSKMDAF